MAQTGAVGSVRQPQVAPAIQMAAVSHAFVLVQGWEKGKQSAITAELEDLRAAAEHNQQLLEQMRAGIRVASDATKAATEAKAQAEEALEKLRTETAQSKAGIDAQFKLLREAQAKFAEEGAAFLSERDKARSDLKAQEGHLKTRAAQLAAREAEADVKLAQATRRWEEAEAKGRRFNSMIEKMKAVIADA